MCKVIGEAITVGPGDNPVCGTSLVGVGTIPTLQVRESLPESTSQRVQKDGWALRSTRVAYRFTNKQIAYLEVKFKIGQSIGRIVEAEAVAKDMRRAVGPDGKRVFVMTEFLTAQQISFFSRMAAKARQQQVPTDADLTASEEEFNFHASREGILSALQQEHPIVFDQYNFCALVSETDKLKDLKLGLLQSLCQEFGLEIPASGRRKKVPHLTLLERLVDSCSCRDSN